MWVKWVDEKIMNETEGKLMINEGAIAVFEEQCDIKFSAFSMLRNCVLVFQKVENNTTMEINYKIWDFDQNFKEN